MNERKVFIIYGHDRLAALELKVFLASIGIKSLSLDEVPSSGLTIIEKFERYAGDCMLAIALLTPDDKQAAELDPAERFRARQNVIFEMGWFMGKRSRDAVILLHRGDVELPSDVSGILYLGFRDSFRELTEDLRRELRARGFA